MSIRDLQQQSIRPTLRSSVHIATLLAATFASNLREIAAASPTNADDSPGATRVRSSESKHTVPYDRTVNSREVRDVHELIREWTPQQQLYHTGSIPAPAPELAAIAEMLRSHPNWSVYVIGNFDRNSQPSARPHMESIKYALRTHLVSTTKFQEVRHRETGEATGNILIISLKPSPNVAVIASIAYTSRGAEPDLSNSIIETLALPPLKDQLRIFDAVAQSVSESDRRFNTQITSEKLRAQRLTDTHFRSIERAVERLERHPLPESVPPTSDLGSIDRNKIIESAKNIRADLSLGNAHQYAKLQELAVHTNDAADAVEKYRDIEGEFVRASRTLEDLSRDPRMRPALTSLTAAADELRTARELHRKADRTYLAKAREVARKIESLTSFAVDRQSQEREGTIKTVLLTSVATLAAGVITVACLGRQYRSYRSLAIRMFLLEDHFSSIEREIDKDSGPLSYPVQQIEARADLVRAREKLNSVQKHLFPGEARGIVALFLGSGLTTAYRLLETTEDLETFARHKPSPASDFKAIPEALRSSSLYEELMWLAPRVWFGDLYQLGSHPIKGKKGVKHSAHALSDSGGAEEGWWRGYF